MDILNFVDGGSGTCLPPGMMEAVDLHLHVAGAIELIVGAIKLFTLAQIVMTFNGGKDACVVFYLLRGALARLLQEEGRATDEEEIALLLRQMKIIYFEQPQEFPEVTSFMQDISQRYGFEYTVYKGSYKDGMTELVGGGVKAVLMGVRKGDPATDRSEYLQFSSSGWPTFLRVNPILTWDYGAVWSFLRGFNLPYCALYDQGYTSLGDYQTTVKNPALAIRDGEKTVYLPAYKLRDFGLERANRQSRENSTASSASNLVKGTVALMCVGDCVASTAAEGGSITWLAEHLRGDGFTVPPVIVASGEERSVMSHINSLPNSMAALVIHCVDEAAHLTVTTAIDNGDRGPAWVIHRPSEEMRLVILNPARARTGVHEDKHVLVDILRYLEDANVQLLDTQPQHRRSVDTSVPSPELVRTDSNIGG